MSGECGGRDVGRCRRVCGFRSPETYGDLLTGYSLFKNTYHTLGSFALSYPGGFAAMLPQIGGSGGEVPRV